MPIHNQWKQLDGKPKNKRMRNHKHQNSSQWITNNQETCVLLVSIWGKAEESNRAAITKLTTGEPQISLKVIMEKRSQSRWEWQLKLRGNWPNWGAGECKGSTAVRKWCKDFKLSQLTGQTDSPHWGDTVGSGIKIKWDKDEKKKN